MKRQRIKGSGFNKFSNSRLSLADSGNKSRSVHRSQKARRSAKSRKPSLQSKYREEQRDERKVEPIKLYRVVLIGKPNVGKSSLFNALTSTDSSIITRQSGTTRDSINRVMRRGENALMLSDLPGWDESGVVEVRSADSKMFRRTRDSNLINPAILSYLHQEVKACDMVVVVTDINDITAEDKMIIDWAREYSYISNHETKSKSKTGEGTRRKPIIYCANKCDNPEAKIAIGEVYELGVENVIMVSAKMKKGLSLLADRLTEKKEELVRGGVPSCNPHVFYPASDYKLTIVGKPNAGKSSLFNAFLRKDRSVVSTAAGTTRDMVEDYLVVGKHTVKLIDTGGLRRKAREKSLPESYSVEKAVHAINQSDVVILVIDAVEGLSGQDKKIAALSTSKKKSLVVALNKWDLITDKWNTYYENLCLTYPSILNFPIVPISCVNRKNLLKLLKIADTLYRDRSRKISNEELNRSLKGAGEMKALAGGGGVKVRYAMQVQNHPPVFYIYVSDLKRLKNSFRKYLYNHLENLYNLKGTPLTLRFFEHQRAKSH